MIEYADFVLLCAMIAMSIGMASYYLWLAVESKLPRG
jgi:hypothetical protein